MQNYLDFKNISKYFPGVQALEDVSFGIAQGSVHGLIGENGAGKSTLIKILSGYYHRDAGSISINGKPVHMSSPFDAINLGINVIQQELQLVANQTVAENIYLGRYASQNAFVSWKKLFADTRAFLDNQSIRIDEKTKISDLTLGQQQLVEIAKAIRYDAKIIAFDEPTSSLSKLEVDILFHIINKLRNQGKVIIYISHRMAEIFQLCDACTVFKDGKHVATHVFSNNKKVNREQLITEMTGKKIVNLYGYRQRPIGEKILEVQGFTGNGIDTPCNLSVHKGEILGIFGLIGAGRSELAQLLYHSMPNKSGRMVLETNEIHPKSPKESIINGIMYCTEDRKKEGIINGRTIWENINISCRRHFSLLGKILSLKREMGNAQIQVDSLNIRTPNLNQDIANLSGGNQQKVILARWLSEKGMKVLIIDEPTRGIDVGSKNEIYNILFTLAEQGIGIIMISSEMPEVVGVCDRIYIMREGIISKELMRNEFDESLILEHSFPQERESYA